MDQLEREGCSRERAGRLPGQVLFAAESLLEDDERLKDTVELFVHDLEGSLHLVKREGMGRHERGIDALHLQHAQEAFLSLLRCFSLHTHTAQRTQGTGNGVQNLTFRKGNIIYSFPGRNYTLVLSHTRHGQPMFRHSWSTMCGRQSEQDSFFTKDATVTKL